MSARLTIAGAARTLNSRAPAHLPALIVMTDTARLADPLRVVDQLPKGAAIILRHYADDDAPVRGRAREELARALARSCRARRLLLLVAADMKLALRIGASGLHIPEWQLRASVGPRRLPRRGFIITAACHSAGAGARGKAGRGRGPSGTGVSQCQPSRRADTRPTALQHAGPWRHDPGLRAGGRQCPDCPAARAERRHRHSRDRFCFRPLTL